MKQKLLYIVLLLTPLNLFARIIVVPEDISTIQEAINSADPGDTVLVTPGTYNENIRIIKEITIASEFILSGDETKVGETIIDGQTKSVFEITAPKDGITNIVGLTIQNGEDGLMVSAPINLLNNIIMYCEDGIDYESGGGGLCKNNLFQNNLDDGIDLDGTLHHIIIENNIISDNEDDGIEIRLHSYQGNPSYCLISNNEIYNNDEDGIQFIDYPDTTNRLYVIERNLIYNNKMCGIGCMDNGDTKEDYRGAAIPEPIFLFNNTISGHNYGITGSSNMVVLNNIIINSTTLGLKNTKDNSVISHNLFFNNGNGNENSNVSDESNLFEDPELSESFFLLENSPCIDRGTDIYISDEDTLLYISKDKYRGTAPDLGTFEYDSQTSFIPIYKNEMELFVYPNPFNNYIKVSVENMVLKDAFKIVDLSGMVVSKFQISEGTFVINTSNFREGLYLLVPDNHYKTKPVKLLKL